MYATTNIYGVVLVLDHRDAQSFTAQATSDANLLAYAAPIITPILTALNLPGLIIGAIIAGFVGYVRLLAEGVKRDDIGFGVYLTFPWPTPGICIPTSRPNVGMPNGWGRVDYGTFKTEDPPDLISYEIQHNSVAIDSVEFSLVLGQSTSGWAKTIIMPDGEGSQWDITVNNRGQEAHNGLWADQIDNGQVLTFRKPKQFGIWFSVLELGYLQDLAGGDRVVFTWQRDT